MRECVVGAFPRSRTELVAGVISPYQDKIYAHLRTMAPSAEGDGEWIRTKRGVALEVDMFEEVLKGLRKLESVAASSVVAARIPKGKDLEVRVYLEPFKNDVYCHVRKYYIKNDRYGSGIAVKVQLLDELLGLAEAMQKAILDRCWEADEDET